MSTSLEKKVRRFLKREAQSYEFIVRELDADATAVRAALVVLQQKGYADIAYGFGWFLTEKGARKGLDKDLLQDLDHQLKWVIEAAEGDSNDSHIEALNAALDTALNLLGLERP